MPRGMVPRLVVNAGCAEPRCWLRGSVAEFRSRLGLLLREQSDQITPVAIFACMPSSTVQLCRPSCFPSRSPSS